MYKVLKGFSYGSVSDPKKVTKGNLQEFHDVDEKRIEKWIKLGWIKKVI